MKPITIEMVNRTIKELKLDILEEIRFKGIDNVYEDDTYTMWETLINKPNLGEKKAQDFLISGLKRLEYRGYDSAGIVTLSEDGSATLLRAKGKITNLEEKLAIQIRCYL